MILSAAEQQLVHIIRAGRGRNLTLTVRVRDRRYSVRIASHDGGPGTGIGFGDSFDAAWRDITEIRARAAGQG
jgi:hypothetical protein